MIKISTKKLSDFFSFKAKTAEEIVKEQFKLNIFSSVLALSFLVFFMFIDKIPVQYTLEIFGVFTEDWFKIGLTSITIFFLFVSYHEKNFSYVVLIAVFLFGHFLFVNVYDDKYSIQATTNKIDVKKKRMKHYSIFQNLA